jgi:hypothetical protein
MFHHIIRKIVQNDVGTGSLVSGVWTRIAVRAGTHFFFVLCVLRLPFDIGYITITPTTLINVPHQSQTRRPWSISTLSELHHVYSNI